MRILNKQTNKQTNKANHKFFKYSALTSALFAFSLPSFADGAFNATAFEELQFENAYSGVNNETISSLVVKPINTTYERIWYDPSNLYRFMIVSAQDKTAITSWSFEGFGRFVGDIGYGGEPNDTALNDWYQGISKSENPTLVVLRRVNRNGSEPANLGRKLMIRTGEDFQNITELPGQDITDKYAFGSISDDGNKIVVNEKIDDSHTRGVIFAFSNEWKNDRTLDNPANTNSSFINLGTPDANVLVGESRNDNNSPFAVVWAARNNWTPIILSSWQGDNLGNQIKQISNDGNTLFGLSAVDAQENAATVWQGDNWQNKYQFTTFANTSTPNFMKMTDDGKIVAVDKSLWSYVNNNWDKKDFENNIVSMTESGRFVITQGQNGLIIYSGNNWNDSDINNSAISSILPSDLTILDSLDLTDDQGGSSMRIVGHTAEDDLVGANVFYAKPIVAPPNDEDNNTNNGGNDNGNGGNNNTDNGGNNNTDNSGNNNTDNGGNNNTDNGGNNNTDNSGNSNTDNGGNSNTDNGDNSNTDNGGNSNTDNGGNNNTDNGGNSNTDNGGNNNGNGGNNTNNGGNNDQPNNANNGNPTPEQPTQPEQPNTSNGNITVTEVVKINVPNTQQAILKMGHDTFELFSLQFGALRRLQEECVAGKGEICYALQHNYTAQNGNDDNAVNLRVGYGFTDNLTFGVNFDRSLRRSLPETYRRLSGNGGVGVFGHYQLPYHAYIAAGIGWDYYRVQAQRPLLANTEFAPTKSRVRGLAWNVTVGQDFTLSNDSQLGWYLAYRQTEIKRNGYRENVPGFPVEYGAANLKDNALAVGAKFALPITPKLSWISAVEFERRLGGESPVYRAKAQYVGDVRYQPDLNHSRWNAQSGVRYAFAPNLSLSLTPFWGNSIVGNNQWGTKLTLEGRF